MSEYHLGDKLGQALGEMEKLEAKVASAEQLAADNAALRRERDALREQIAILIMTQGQMQRTIAAFVAAAQKAQQQKRDPWGYEDAMARSARKQQG